MRVSILFGLGMGLVFVALGVFVVVPREVKRSLRENLMLEFDDGVLAQARALAPLIEYESGRYEFDLPAGSVPASGAYLEVTAGDGSVLRSSTPRIDAPEGRGGRAPHFFNRATPDGALRLVKLRLKAVVEQAEEDEEDGPLEPASGQTMAASDPNPGAPFADVVLGVPRTEIDARIASVSRVVDESLLLLGFIMLLFVAGSVVYAWRALRGVTRNLAAAPASGLGPIAWQPRPPRELEALTQALDGALAKAGAAIERERDVIAGLAHELRTPVAEMLATTEIALDQPGKGEALRPALTDVRQVALQLKATVETMLTVARGKAPEDARRFETVDLVALWDEVSDAARSKAAPRDVTFARRGAEAVSVRCDPAALRIVSTTLAENAALHAPVGSEVEVTLRDEADAATLSVSNPAPHLADADIAHLTEPLWHKAGQGAAHRGLGLGLYLASEVAGHAGMTLDAALRKGRLTATVRLPRTG